MGKEAKTNAMRMLEKKKIPYEAVTYECDEFIDGLHSAEKTGAPVDASFKTLVMQGKSRQYYVFVMPIAMEVDLKKAAKAVGEKIGGDDPCKGYYKDHRLCPGRLFPAGDEEASSPR